MAKRSEVWIADLNPIKGSEQAGIRPVIVIQNDALNAVTTTVLAIPLTTNLSRSVLPSCVRIEKGDGGLENASVALGHQLRVLDSTRLLRKIDILRPSTMSAIEGRILFTLGIV